jgi:hypothetical protein
MVRSSTLTFLPFSLKCISSGRGKDAKCEVRMVGLCSRIHPLAHYYVIHGHWFLTRSLVRSQALLTTFCFVILFFFPGETLKDMCWPVRSSCKALMETAILSARTLSLQTFWAISEVGNGLSAQLSTCLVGTIAAHPCKHKHACVYVCTHTDPAGRPGQCFSRTTCVKPNAQSLPCPGNRTSRSRGRGEGL